jgi:uncharacterized membrane protein YhaH (DUF805 family)
MSFAESVKTVFSKYATFSGRARRAEFWWFALFAAVVNLVLSILGAALGGATPDPVTGETSGAGLAVGILALVVGLALVLPTLAVTVRRLHDTDRSGWWWFIGLVPFVGAIVLLVFELLPGTPGPNRFGPDPKGTELPGAGYGAPTYPGAGQPPSAY